MPFHFSALYKKNPKRAAVAGFSMIELLVSISIIVMVLTITLTRQSSFNSAVLLRSEAFDIALAIREIQLSAVSAASDGSGEFRSTQGVYFNTATPNRYVPFRDTAGGGADNSAYDAGEEISLPGLIDSRFAISAINTVDVDGSESGVSVVFERPNFDAQFYDASANLITAAAVQIELRLSGTTGGNCGDQWRTIEVTRAGQIAVLNCP